MGGCGNAVFPMEDALEMILLFDGQGIISYANASAREKMEYGSKQENGLCGRHISSVFPNTFRYTEDGFETTYPFGGRPQNLVAYRSNLTCFPVEAKIILAAGNPVTYICMANDILEKEFLSREVEKVRQEAQEAAKVKSEFVANVTHELRTPVNGIQGNVRELLDGVEDSRLKKSLLLVERCCGDMNKIINNILDFSKLEAGKFVLEPRRFHIRNMLDYVRSQHISRITEKGLEFFMTVAPQVPESCVGDELRTVQILNNLLSNALKFTSVGKITVEVFRTARVNDRMELFFVVSDTGIGIGREDRDKLFQSFSQVDASVSRKYGGTGLGLNICKQLVELMGGKIGMESERGKGSTFFFSIWVGACGEEGGPQQPEGTIKALEAWVTARAKVDGEEALENTKIYGTRENRESLEKNLSKLILCVEMENWEKAEMFMETIRQLTEEAPHEVKRAALRLKMAIQKENYDKVTVGYEELKSIL